VDLGDLWWMNWPILLAMMLPMNMHVLLTCAAGVEGIVMEVWMHEKHFVGSQPDPVPEAFDSVPVCDAARWA
jgi:hypothetical protein